MASTAYQSMEPSTAMRSNTPIHGVGSLSATLGASKAFRAPNTRTATIVAIEYERNRFPNAVAPAAMLTTKKSESTPLRMRCMVSLNVAPPAARTARSCIGANGHTTPERPTPTAQAPTTRRARFPLADAHTPSPKATTRRLYTGPSVNQIHRVGAPTADNSLIAWSLRL